MSAMPPHRDRGALGRGAVELRAVGRLRPQRAQIRIDPEDQLRLTRQYAIDQAIAEGRGRL